LKINEIFYSIQGEGKHTGIPTLFIRLSGCNLRCNYCDTRYALENGHTMSEQEIVKEAKKYWSNNKPLWVCITGGEPLLQDIRFLIDMLMAEGFKVQIESNGTVFLPIDCDWLVISPKTSKKPLPSMLERADEVKVVIDSEESLEFARQFDNYKAYLSVQAVDNNADLIKHCIEFVKANPKWRLSIQTHKLLDIP
jgi:7-carboxy-7-deazaguanine synthase